MGLLGRLRLFIFTVAIANAQSWAPQTAATQASLRGVSALNEHVVWASGTGGTYLVTTDGGANWRVGVVPGAEKLDFRAVWATGERSAYLLSSGEGDLSRVFHTKDGGAHWQLLWTNPDAKGFFDALAFLSPHHGFVLGDPVNGHFALFETSDGGRHWRELKAPEALPNEGAFAASGSSLQARDAHIWFASGGKLADGARVFHSDDGGDHWTIANTPVRSDGAGAGIFSLAFAADHRHGVAAGGDYTHPADATGNLALTGDSGLTWHAPKGKPPAGYRSAVVYLEGRHAWLATGPTGSDISNDGGESWTTFDTGAYNALAFTASGAGWAVGPKGRIAAFRGR